MLAHLRRPDHVEPIPSACVAVAGHAADGAQFVLVDAVVVEVFVIDVDADHFTQHQISPVHKSTQLDGVEQPALHIDMGLGHTRRFYQVAWNRSEARHLKLVYIRRIVAGAQIHVRPEFFGHDIDNKFARCGDVAQSVFARIGVDRGARP